MVNAAQSSAPRIDADELIRLANDAGYRQQIEYSESHHKDAIMEGRFALTSYPSGLSVHLSDLKELQTLSTSMELPPKLTLSVILRGKLDFDLGDSNFEAGGAGPECFALSIPRHQTFHRRLRANRCLTKVNISVSREWLECRSQEEGAAPFVMEELFSEDVIFAKWPASTRLIALAEQILNPPPLNHLLLSLYIESRAMELLSDGMLMLPQHINKPRTDAFETLKPQDNRRIATAREFIEAHLDTIDSLEETAAAVGMSVSTLQRRFKNAYGRTVFEYVRQRKLESARDALLKKELSIGEAAYKAGYRHPSNFVTAFKRAFGATPGEL
ncbi:AraC-type DNA-binding domain-containing protein [Hahella chejuensis KCTC 2396]|uniref:AraC-type DNA-binding domain-containing protein n=1 Tax=Hahella chejuensis (strain KCTC 2396) TaxID=349521 RepID=Q2SME8_HAHCH|nr:AraC family transcriptional regulator [Hahella chejuensis]ABC28176.1 AraC-type DNA-binding domain-containing protein [Hahella chejuensis KCTC 2396]